MTWVTPPTFTALAGATAAMFNKFRDNFNVIGGAWSTYVPTINGSTTNPTIGSSTVAGRYRLTGQTVDIQISITIGAGFSAGSGSYSFSLPSGVAILNSSVSEALGIGTARDVSVPTTRGFWAYPATSSAVALFNHDDAALNIVGSATPYTWATGDRITINIRGMEIV